MDQVIIKDLVARGIIGVYEWERQEPQDILINVILFTDLSQTGTSDNLEGGVDYHAVAKKILAYAEKAGRFTVEALATDLVHLCLKEPGVQKVRLRVEKRSAVRFVGSVGVEIERDRGE